MKILLLDDNIALVKSIEKFFHKGGNHVDAFHSRSEFMEKKVFDYDVYILDIGLEDGNGLDIARYLREKVQTQAPIMVVSGYEGLETKLEGFEIGINDYIVKPFSPLELEARIKSIIHRSQLITPAKKNLHYKNITFHCGQRKVLLDGKEMDLSKKEKQILEYFMINQDNFVSKHEFIEAIRGSNYDNEKISNTINVSICKIRKKLGDTFCLNTINSEGYILENSDFPEKITLDHIMSEKS